MESTLPPIIEERVPGAYGVEFRAGSTASPGLSDIELVIRLDREPVTADDLSTAIDAIFETNSLWSVYKVDVRVFGEDDDGLECLDLAEPLAELGLSQHAFDLWGCTIMVADYGDLRDWWEAR